MPNYNSTAISNSPIPALYAGDSFFLFNNELPIAGQASQQVALGENPGGEMQTASVELLFPADPGAFEFDVQVADTDVDDAYRTVPAVGQMVQASGPGANGKFSARLELAPVRANFLRIQCVTPSANNKAVTAKVTR